MCESVHKACVSIELLKKTQIPLCSVFFLILTGAIYSDFLKNLISRSDFVAILMLLNLGWHGRFIFCVKFL